jgi:ribose transport system ATP-binding protein
MDGSSLEGHPTAAASTAPGVPRVDLRGVGKAFGTTMVLQGVDLTVMPGDIVGLVGQNGAGKSTLMKILGGVYPDHDGTVAIDGTIRHLMSPRAALRAGVGMIYQELSLVSSMSVAENIMLGMEPGRFRHSRRELFARARDLTGRLPVMRGIRLDAVVGDLGAGVQQRVEIAKALLRDATVLVMDEPTARLDSADRSELHAVVRDTARTGIGVIYISHFLEEVFDLANKITVLRNGRVIASGAAGDFTMRSLTRAMLGAEQGEEARAQRPAPSPSAAVLLRARGLASAPRLRHVDLDVHAGEIVGLGGLVGSGRSWLLRVLAAAEPATGGRIEVQGRPVRARSPRDALKAGIALLAEDRKGDGIVGPRPAAENLQLMALDFGLSWLGLVRRAKGRAIVAQAMHDFEVHPADPRKAAALFSGGNQQKLVIARALLASPVVLLGDQPTAGVDVGTKAMIHRILRDAADRGLGIVIASDDLDELFAVSDRVLVMRDGEIIAEHARADLDRELVIEQMSQGIRQPLAAGDASG